MTIRKISSAMEEIIMEEVQQFTTFVLLESVYWLSAFPPFAIVDKHK
jgi:hypothetical protein